MSPFVLVKRIAMSAAALGGVLCVACTQAPADAGPAADADHEATGTAKEALGEPGCGLPNRLIERQAISFCFNSPWDPQAWAVTQPDSSKPQYCPDQAIYDVSYSTGIVSPQVAPQDWPTTQAACTTLTTSTQVLVQMHGSRSWVTLGAGQAPLRWVQTSPPQNTWECVYGPTTGNTPATIDLSRYDRVRIVGEVFLTQKGAFVSVPSKANVQSGCLW